MIFIFYLENILILQSYLLLLSKQHLYGVFLFTLDVLIRSTREEGDISSLKMSVLHGLL